MPQLQRQNTPDEIAAGFQSDRTTDLLMGFPGPRSARTMLSGVDIMILPACMYAGDGFSGPAPEWHASVTNLGFVYAVSAGGRPRPAAVEVTHELQVHQRLLTASVGVQAREALAALAITKRQMAEILGIERPHLYAWIADKVARPTKGGRLRDLLKALQASGISSSRPLRSHLLTEPLEPGAQPLIALLKSKDLGSVAITIALATAVRLNRAIDEEANQRQSRMRAAGHQAPGDEEAQVTLDTTLTMTGWDDA